MEIIEGEAALAEAFYLLTGEIPEGYSLSGTFPVS